MRKRYFGPVHSRVTRWSKNTNPREKMMRFSRDIRDAKGLILLTRAGGPPSKSASKTRAAQRFRLWPAFKGICTVPTHLSAPEKRKTLSRHPPMMGSRLLHRAGCPHSDGASQRLLLARHSDFGSGQLSKASARSQRTDPRRKSERLCRDIHQ